MGDFKGLALTVRSVMFPSDNFGTCAAFAIGSEMSLGTLTGDRPVQLSMRVYQRIRAFWKHACPNVNVDTNLFGSLRERNASDTGVVRTSDSITRETPRKRSYNQLMGEICNETWKKYVYQK